MTRQTFLSADDPSFLDGHNAAYLEALEARSAVDPDSLAPDWQAFFRGIQGLGDGQKPGLDHVEWPPLVSDKLANGSDKGSDLPNPATLEKKISATAQRLRIAVSEDDLRQAVLDSVRALMLIRAYRIRGHLLADLDPLKAYPRDEHPELEPAHFGFGEADMDRPIFIDNIFKLEMATMRQILDIVRRTYCGTFALQYMHISDAEQSLWLKERIEGYDNEIIFTRKGRRAILNKLVEAEGFEKFLHMRYPGAKRFGLDGGESLVPAMEQIIKRGGQMGVNSVIIGMPHRGRLSVLANVLQKPYHAIFNEFQGGSFKPHCVEGSGDVKYHLGASADREFDGNTVHLSLTANPSHLEAVDPVVLGKVRAKQDQMGDESRTKVLPVLLHGDAAFAGQGVVAECFALSGLKGYRTGGTIHIVVNNQIGFTTAPHFSRSSPYPTDIARMVEAPIFHVNGDDPEAVVHAARVATEFRQIFNKDVVIDLVCYRRFGHNEGDEPMFTNPIMYKKIKSHKTTLSLYSERLIAEGEMRADEVSELKSSFHARMVSEFEASNSYEPNMADWLGGRWKNFKPSGVEYQRGDTAISQATFDKVSAALVHKPENMTLHPTIERILNNRTKMLESGENFDWAMSEALAFGSLLLEGFPVRFSGQDSVRGTFSHRHAGLVDQNTEDRYYSLNHISQNQAGFEIIDSPLSEYAVLGFEYGYSLAEPHALTIWEAQFGDFANGAQIMIDQFISAGESKWLRMSGLVMLLPHGFEGQGPEHSSARLERFLQMSNQSNWVIANCTTPANYYHLLRRHMYRTYRKPLIVMSPKSLLRHKRAVSNMHDFLQGTSYHRVLFDDADDKSKNIRLVSDKKIRRVVICSGKIYYDLLEGREARGIDDIYLLRIEQFHPFPQKALATELLRFKNAEMIWCQEEPKNQGGWSYIDPLLEITLNEIGAKHKRPAYCGRQISASPATGLLSEHKIEQEALIEDALSQEGRHR